MNIDSNIQTSETSEVQDRIREIVGSDRVVLFMKGTRAAPQCGFSMQVVQILDRLLPDYTTFNVLADPDVREGVKVFSDWPTIPQLYVGGEFQGGCDIVRELYENGELHQLLGVERGVAGDVAVAASEDARRLLREAQERQGGTPLHLSVDAQFRHSLGFGPAAGDEIRVDLGDGLELLVDTDSAPRANGLSLDVVPGPQGPSLRIDNPNAPRVPQMSAQDLAALRADNTAHRLVDVRSRGERASARIEGSELFDDVLAEELRGLPRDTLIVFHCHTGRRSQAVAESFAARGFTNVHNLEGGIDRWSLEVDPSVPRY